MAEQYEMSKGVTVSSHEHGANAGINDFDELAPAVKEGFTVNDQRDMQRMGKKQEFRRNFHFLTTVGFTCCVVSLPVLPLDSKDGLRDLTHDRWEHGKS